MTGDTGDDATLAGDLSFLDGTSPPDDVAPPDDGTSTPGEDATSPADDTAEAGDTPPSDDVTDPPLIGATGLEAAGADEGVALSWTGAPAATGYRVERCDVRPYAAAACVGRWAPVGQVSPDLGRFVDAGADVAPAPSAPSELTATSNDPDRIFVAWKPVEAPSSPEHAYRVVAETASGEAPPSEVVVAARPTPAISGYGLSWDGGRTWTGTPPDQTEFVLEGAPAPSVMGTIRASQGTEATHVRVAFDTPVRFIAGGPVSFDVRAETALAAGQVGQTTGLRAAPTDLRVRWERSSGSASGDFIVLADAVPMTGAVGEGLDDTTAPVDGGVREYRAVLSASGVTPWTTPVVTGWRKPPNLVVPGVQASDDLPDRVRVTWEAVSGANAYDVYRDGVRQATVSALSWDDLAAPAPSGGWAAPSNVKVTSGPSSVGIEWFAPARPVGVASRYTVRVVGAATDSAADMGQRAEAALAGWDVEVTRNGQSLTYSVSSIAPRWTDPDAPAFTLGVANVQASAGTRRAAVGLSGGIASASPPVATYRVRGRLADSRTTPYAAGATGSRTLGVVSHRWLRSQTDSATSAYDPIASGWDTFGPSFDDPGAPADGARRFYRLEGSAEGADSVTSDPVPGFRLAFRKVSAGGNHACAISVQGHLWCWGARTRGQLGTGVQATGLATPVRVSTEVVTDVAAGYEHTCVIRAGQVACWGGNDHGECGSGAATVLSPTPVQGVSQPIGLASGRHFTCAVTRAGQVLCWGRNHVGQLGRGSTGASTGPATVLVPSAAAPMPLADMLMVSASPAGSHACAAGTGLPFCWGANEAGQVGTGQGSPSVVNAQKVRGGDASVVHLAAGGSHTCTFSADGFTRGWGLNSSGQVGQPTTTANVWSPASNTNVAELSASTLTSGTDHGCLFDRSGALYCWGGNGKGQLGVRTAPGGPAPVLIDVLSRTSAVSAGDLFTCAIADGGLWCWGLSTAGQAGVVTTSVFSPTELALP